MSNLGDLTIQLKLDIRPYAAAMKSAIAMAKSFKTSAGTLLKIEPGKLDVSKIDAEMTKLGATLKTYEVSSKTAGASTGKFKTELDSLSASGGNVKRGLGDMATMFAIFSAGVVLALLKIKDAWFESFNIGTQLASLRRSFEGVSKDAGVDAVEILESLKKSTAGTVKEFRLLQIASRGHFLGVDIKAIPELLEFATIRAVQMGKEVDVMTERIIEGLGRKSPQIMDDLGIKMSQLDEKVIEVAASHGVLIDTVDEQTRSFYLTEAAVLLAREQMEKSTITLEDQIFTIQELKTQFSDLKDRIAESFSDKLLSKIAGLQDALLNTSKKTDDSTLSFDKLIRKIKDIDNALNPILNLIDNLTTAVQWGQDLGISLDNIRWILNQSAGGALFNGIIDGIIASYNWALKLLNVMDAMGATPEFKVWGTPHKATISETLKKDDKTGRTGQRGNTQREQTEKEILSILEQERKKLAELKKEYELNADSLLAQLEIYEKILKIQERIYELQFGPRISNIPFQKLPPLDRWTPEEYPGHAKADIVSTERFKAANLMLNELGNTLNDSLSKAWEDSFGKADNLAANFIRSIISKLIQGMINNAVSSLMNSIFPGAGVVIPSVFGGGGASPAGMPGGGGMNPPAGMPGAGGFMGRAPIVNNVNNVSQPPINVNIQANVPFDHIVTKGMPGYQLRVNQTKVK